MRRCRGSQARCRSDMLAQALTNGGTEFDELRSFEDDQEPNDGCAATLLTCWL